MNYLRGTILFVLLLIFPLFVFPQRYRVPTSAISSHKWKVPEYCWDSYDTIHCYELCKDDSVIEAILNKPRQQQGNDLYIQSLNLTSIEDLRITPDHRNHGIDPIPGVGYPCENKCESDPVYWTCIAECDKRDHTAFWIDNCISMDFNECTMNTIYNSSCLECLANATLDRLWQSCEISYLPDGLVNFKNLCETMDSCGAPAGGISQRTILEILSDCLADPTVTSTMTDLEMLRMCVNDKIMYVQKHCCYSNDVREGTLCRNDMEKCDDICTRILTPRLCRETCEQLRDPEIKECAEVLCEFYFPTPSDICDHCSTIDLVTGIFKTCSEDCYATAGCSMPTTCTPSPTPPWLIRNCHNPLNLHRLAQFIGPPIIPVDFNTTASEWMSSHFTPEECTTECQSQTPSPIPATCIECLKQVRPHLDILQQCQINPYRSVEMLACALEEDLQGLNLEDNIVPNAVNLASCSKKNYSVRKLLYQAIFEYEQSNGCFINCMMMPSGLPHPNEVDKVRCKIDQCQSTGKSPYCQKMIDPHVVRLPDFSTCRWRVDFSKQQNPYILWEHYFNELAPADIKHRLEHPDTTNILQKSTVDEKEGFYTFPYFIVVRSMCDGAGYYADGAYRFFMVGGNPTVELKYLAPTSRQRHRALVRGIFQSALIKLKRTNNDNLVPVNPRSIDDTGENGCHANICHPGFAVPMMFLNLPHFDVVVDSQEVFSDLQHTVYVSPFHTRAISGQGEIQIALGDHPTHAAMLFPTRRSSFATDSELSYHGNCIANDITDAQSPEYLARKCPEIDHLLDDFDKKYSTGRYDPMDAEDILRSQYTFGTSPVQVIAGFYDPRLLIIGDADMNQYEVVNWGKLLKELERPPKPDFHPCIQTAFKNRGYAKPIYSLLDRTDEHYPIKYYRQRYAPLEFENFMNATSKTPDDEVVDTAIFEAIALEDRLLLITTRGLVSFYGHTHATVLADKAWTYSKTEVLNRCFKLVRILRKVQPSADSIVGITYDYVVRNTYASGPKYMEISQQIWMGKYVTPAEEISWTEIKDNANQALIVGTRPMNELIPPGESVTFAPGKEPGLPYETREANPKSQIEAICYKAFRGRILAASHFVSLSDDPGWCDAIDATPIVMREDSIQVLVRLRINFQPTGSNNTKMYFYVIASHTVKQGSTHVVWQIDSILPRFPCIDEHVEALKNILVFDARYFQAQKVGTEVKIGCKNVFFSAKYAHVYLHGMTYSRTLTNHLFLYGSRLLQSTDHGKSFVVLRSFPRRYQNFDFDTAHDDATYYRNVHRIVLMAFDDSGHYAFLTNKLELWLGSSGATEQIVLRPSPLRSMVQLGVSKVKTFNSGIPFSMHFDSTDRLYEMVTILDEKGRVSRVMKRYVAEWKLLRVKHMLKKFEEQSDELVRFRKRDGNLTHVLQTPFNYPLSKWSTFCPFVSPNLRQNYSRGHGRTQGMFFPHPMQHLSLGKGHIEGSLMTFQAACFNLIWRAFFNTPKRFYAGVDKDPFDVWIHEKRDAATLALVRFVHGSPERDGIVVQPRRYKRVAIGALTSIIKHYFMDLNLTVELRFEFSIKNDLMALYTDFEAEQINEIQLNAENANGSIIQINTEREVHAHIASILFVVRLSVKRRTGLGQNLPGKNLLPVPITFHLIGAFGNCIQNRATGIIGDSLQTVAVVGCPASRDFVFNWNSTLSSIKFRDLTEHGTHEKCPNNAFACFFARNPIVLFFDIFDESQQSFIPYLGKYTMRVVAGGRTKEAMRNYTTEEIEAFNIPGVSDVSLIWNEWDPTKHQKVEKKPQVLYNDEGKEVNRDNREVILQAGTSTIMWACHTLSPCVRIRPTKRLEVVFWFRLQISNRDVDDQTLCLYDKEFDILLYGFPPSPEFQLATTLGFCCFLLSILYVCYLCFRGHSRLWRTTKVNIKNWFNIVKESFPKKLRLHEPPLPDEQTEHVKRKHRGLGSQEFAHDSTSSFRRESGIPLREKSSMSSMGSGSTSMASSQMLPDNKPNFLLGGAKEVIYDQILTRRLNSIVVRNREMRDNLLKKASVQVPRDDVETEAHFEMQFGRTVSQESVFTPPMPKDRKGGIDSFF